MKKLVNKWSSFIWIRFTIDSRVDDLQERINKVSLVLSQYPLSFWSGNLGLLYLIDKKWIHIKQLIHMTISLYKWN